MLPIARAAARAGSARNFRRRVNKTKMLWRNEHHRGRRPAVWSPGEYLVIDWAQAAPGLLLHCAVLAFSQWRFVAFATDQRATTLGLADRMACLKGGVVANVVLPTAEYVRLARPRGLLFAVASGLSFRPSSTRRRPGQAACVDHAAAGEVQVAAEKPPAAIKLVMERTEALAPVYADAAKRSSCGVAPTQRSPVPLDKFA